VVAYAGQLHRRHDGARRILAELSIGFDRHRPRARLQLPARDLHGSGLAAAVSADQALAVPADELHGNVCKKGFGFSGRRLLLEGARDISEDYQFLESSMP